MRTSVAALAALVTVLLVLAHPVLGHQGEDHGGADPSGNLTDPEAGEGPRLHGYDEYLGRTWWGLVHEIPHPDSHPSNPVISDGWVAWLDRASPSDSDVLAYNLTRGVRVQVTDDDADQGRPALDGSHLVWTEQGGEANRVIHHDLEAGTDRLVFETDAEVQSATVSDPYVAWQTRQGPRDGASFQTWDVVAYDLRDDRTIPVTSGNATDVDPVVVGDHVLWREREYSQWDVRVQDLTTGREDRVTADINEEVSLRADDDSALFLQRHRDSPGLHAFRYLPEADRIIDLGFDAPLQDGIRPAGDAVLFEQPFVDGSTLEMLPPEARDSHRLILPRIPLHAVSNPANGTLAAVVGNESDPQLITYTYSPLATSPPPTVAISQPEAGDVLSNRTTVQGTVQTPDPWPDPIQVYVTFTSVDSWVTATGTTDWQATLDLSNVPSGRNTLRVAAEFPDGPPHYAQTQVIVGEPLDFTKDLGPRFESQGQGLVAAILQTIPLLVVLVLALVAAILLALRTYLRWLRQRYPEVEYVPPDEPRTPHDNPAEATGRTRDQDHG